MLIWSMVLPITKVIKRVVAGQASLLQIHEDAEVAYKETRMIELMGIKKILDKYRDLVLQVRVGGTDFSN